VVAVPMDAGRWNEPGQALEELEGSEAKHFATVHIGLGEPIHQASLRRGERPDTGGGVEPLQGERPARTVWMAELAVARGHHVTLFNRGRREKFLGSADGTESLYGNRDPKLHAQTKVVDGKEVDDGGQSWTPTEFPGQS